MTTRNKILVTGGNGLLGSQIVKLLKDNNSNYLSCSSKSLDLINYSKIDSFFKKNKIFHI